MLIKPGLIHLNASKLPLHSFEASTLPSLVIVHHSLKRSYRFGNITSDSIREASTDQLPFHVRQWLRLADISPYSVLRFQNCSVFVRAVREEQQGFSQSYHGFCLRSLHCHAEKCHDATTQQAPITCRTLCSPALGFAISAHKWGEGETYSQVAVAKIASGKSTYLNPTRV